MTVSALSLLLVTVAALTVTVLSSLMRRPPSTSSPVRSVRLPRASTMCTIVGDFEARNPVTSNRPFRAANTLHFSRASWGLSRSSTSESVVRHSST
ncbi:hypothetical protein SUDANB123_04470 [Nocardiopsis dassonvillei]